MYKVEKGVPIAAAQTGRPMAYPWTQMEVGDSFAVPSPPKNIRNITTAAGKRYEKKFAIRKQDKGVRIWRVA